MQKSRYPGPSFTDETRAAVKTFEGRRSSAPTAKGIFEVCADVRESATEYAVFLDVPGVDEDDLAVVWDADELVVSGIREFDHDLEDAEQFIRLERSYGPFQYRVTFEKPVIASDITAKYRRGVLKIRIPKSATADRREASLTNKALGL